MTFSELLKHPDATVLKAFDENEALVSTPTDLGVSPILHAVYMGRRELAERLRDRKGVLDLHEASAMGDLHQVEAKLPLTAEGIDAYSPDGFTALGYAAYFGHRQVLDRLLKEGANPNLASRNAMKVTPLHSALAGGHKEMARALVAAGADVNAESAEGYTPLRYCQDRGDVETEAYLREHGAR